MNRGLIFSTDAIFATIFVVVLAAAFSFYYINAPTNAQFIEKLNYEITDAALVGFYLDKNADDFEEFSGTFVDANHSKCLKIYDYNILFEIGGSALATQSPILDYNFCRGFG